MLKTMEQELLEKIADSEKENENLKQQLEITQAVLDELLLGGTE
jgi:hypothetical protein